MHMLLKLTSHNSEGGGGKKGGRKKKKNIGGGNKSMKKSVTVTTNKSYTFLLLTVLYTYCTVHTRIQVTKLGGGTA